MILVVVLLASLTLTRCQNFNSCPSSENIRPCTCLVGQDKKPWITCDKLKSADQLAKAVEKMKGYSITSFNIAKSNIGILPSDIFNNMEIETLNIFNSNLTKLGDSRNRPALLGLENSLQSINIKESFVNKNMPLSTLSLSHLKKLNILQLEKNLMPIIGNNWFENGPYGLKQLHLLNTNTSVLGSHAFEALENLEYFYLTGGSLTEVTRDLFPLPALFLQSIDLNNNKLKTLPADIFTKMPALDQIFLENNLFTTIDEVTWAPIWSQLQYVYFHGNPMNCNIDLKWIYKYRLPEYFAGYCTLPNKLRNKDLRNITITDLE